MSIKPGEKVVALSINMVSCGSRDRAGSGDLRDKAVGDEDVGYKWSRVLVTCDYGWREEENVGRHRGQEGRRCVCVCFCVCVFVCVCLCVWPTPASLEIKYRTERLGPRVGVGGGIGPRRMRYLAGPHYCGVR